MTDSTETSSTETATIESDTTPAPTVDVYDRIIEACQAEIDKHGIIGMRVATVAERADTTVAMIYRRFGDRDGLLAHTLGAYYRSRISIVVDVIEERAARPEPVTIDDVLNLTPNPHHPGSEDLHRNLPRITVTAAENFALRVQVEGIVREGMRRFESALEKLVDRMAPEEQFDPRIFSYLIVNLTWMYNDLRGDETITNEQYKAFLRKLLEDSTRPA